MDITTTKISIRCSLVDIKEAMTILILYDINTRRGHNYLWKIFILEFKR